MSLFDFFKRRPLVIPAADPPKLVRPFDADEVRHRFPKTAAQRLFDLAAIYAQTEIEFPELKEITLAQWCIESAWGNSRAAREETNFAGMKWRDGDRKFCGKPSDKSGFDGYEHGVRYTHFPTKVDFINAYWARLDEVSAYRGWRKHTQGPVEFIGAIGPPWVGYNTDAYVSNVISTWKKYTRGLFT